MSDGFTVINDGVGGVNGADGNVGGSSVGSGHAGMSPSAIDLQSISHSLT